MLANCSTFIKPFARSVGGQKLHAKLQTLVISIYTFLNVFNARSPFLFTISIMPTAIAEYS